MVYLYVVFDILFFILLGFLIYRFVTVLRKMREPILFPTTKKTLDTLRNHPEKPLDKPDFANQKTGILIYGGMLLFVLAIYIFGIIFDAFSLSMYFVLILPFSYSQDILNLFAITEDGILSEVRFITWEKIKSFEFIPIHLNHKYYGFSKEANTGYELKIKTTGRSISCVVTSEETKELLRDLLSTKTEEVAS